jgi:hypothetical protein
MAKSRLCLFIECILPSGRDRFPEKNSIKQLFTEIGRKAQPNDILLVFFAGHGVVESEKNQFYFLTADASNVTVTGALKNVGIGTEEIGRLDSATGNESAKKDFDL